MKQHVYGLLALLLCTGAGAQAPAAQAPNATSPTEAVADYFSASFLAEHVPALMEKARAGDGTGTLVLKRFPGNYMNLMVRTKDRHRRDARRMVGRFGHT